MSKKPKQLPKIKTARSTTAADAPAAGFDISKMKGGSKSALTLMSTTSHDMKNLDKHSQYTRAPPSSLDLLTQYLDWRSPSFHKDEINAVTWLIASTIWEMLPAPDPYEHTISLDKAIKHNVDMSARLPNQPAPVQVAVSAQGELLYCYQCKKDMIDDADKVFHIVLVPKIENIYLKGVSKILTQDSQIECSWWEVEDMEVTHIAFDKDNNIQFTNGEEVYQISYRADGGLLGCYADEPIEIWAPKGDTNYVSSLWRQGDFVYFTVQDWENEDVIDLYKIKSMHGKSSNDPTTPTSPATSSGRRQRSTTSPRNFDMSRSPSRNSTGSRRGSRSSPRGGKNSPIVKVRQFSLRFNERVWQLRWLRFEKKMMIGIAACRATDTPKMMNIAYKKDLRLFEICGKKAIWPSNYTDLYPHLIIQHRPTRTWLTTLTAIKPVKKQKKASAGRHSLSDSAPHWIQFRLDATRRKTVWHRNIPIPEHFTKIIWSYYDEMRDVLVGWRSTDEPNQQYKIHFLTDLSKWLTVEEDAPKKKKKDGDKAPSAADTKKAKETRRKLTGVLTKKLTLLDES